MRGYDEALAAAEDRPAFSNGAEGECWMDNWCYRCRNDSPEMVDRGEGCPLIMVALLGKTPAEWVDEKPGSLADRYRCTEFRPDHGDDPDAEPEPDPPPEIPGQLDLFTAAMLDDIETELGKPLEVAQ